MTMTLINYEAYIRSGEWQARRALLLRQNGKKCAACGRTGILDVHHKTYERLGAELLTDLVVLCADCHKGAHQLHKVTPFTSLATATDLYIGFIGGNPRKVQRKKARRRSRCSSAAPSTGPLRGRVGAIRTG